MSHRPERKEKNCLNCGTTVQGKYCHVCGQENAEPKETFWGMVTHFFYDITHFDSSFFHTIHHLILKPGFLSREYMSGRRASYLHPVRMYVFTSALFFLLFFSLFKIKDNVTLTSETPLNNIQRAEYIISLQNRLKKDSSNKTLKAKLILFNDTTLQLSAADTIENTFKDFKSIAEYDSAQKALPSSKRAGWLKNLLTKKRINIINKYRKNPEEALTKLLENFFHRLPYLLFVSLPIFAYLLKLVYIRRKNYFFADHGVFTIHLYIFSFIVLMVAFGLGKLQDITRLKFMETVTVLLLVGLLSYLYIAMYNFYKQRWGKTFIKLLLISFLSVIMILFLFFIFLLFSFATF